METLLCLAAAAILWFLRELLWWMAGELIWEVFAPVRNVLAPITRRIRGRGVGRLLFFGGCTGLVMGFVQLNTAVTVVQARLGVALFLGGAVVGLVGYSVWRESGRLERRIGTLSSAGDRLRA